MMICWGIVGEFLGFGWRALTEFALPLLGIAATTAVAVAALHATRSANRTAEAALELERRQHRREFVRTVQAYFDGRLPDLRSGANSNMPHYTHEVVGAARQIDEPNAMRLLKWVIDAMDAINQRMTNEHHRGINAHFLELQLPIVSGDWIREPASFAPAPFKLWEERDAFDVLAEEYRSYDDT